MRIINLKQSCRLIFLFCLILNKDLSFALSSKIKTEQYHDIFCDFSDSVQYGHEIVFEKDRKSKLCVVTISPSEIDQLTDSNNVIFSFNEKLQMTILKIKKNQEPDKIQQFDLWSETFKVMSKNSPSFNIKFFSSNQIVQFEYGNKILRFSLFNKKFIYSNFLDIQLFNSKMQNFIDENDN